MEYNPTMPQSSMPLEMYPQNSTMGNPQYNQLMNAQNAQQPMQDPMADYKEQMRQQQALKMMGQGIQNIGRGMQMQMPSGNTAQIFRDQSHPQFSGYIGGGQAMNPQQQMAQALRNRG